MGPRFQVFSVMCTSGRVFRVVARTAGEAMEQVRAISPTSRPLSSTRAPGGLVWPKESRALSWVNGWWRSEEDVMVEAVRPWVTGPEARLMVRAALDAARRERPQYLPAQVLPFDDRVKW